jgi:hypothetical protein
MTKKPAVTYYSDICLETLRENSVKIWGNPLQIQVKFHSNITASDLNVLVQLADDTNLWEGFMRQLFHQN